MKIVQRSEVKVAALMTRLLNGGYLKVMRFNWS